MIIILMLRIKKALFYIYSIRMLMHQPRMQPYFYVAATGLHCASVGIVKACPSQRICLRPLSQVAMLMEWNNVTCPILPKQLQPLYSSTLPAVTIVCGTYNKFEERIIQPSNYSPRYFQHRTCFMSRNGTSCE